MVGPNLVELHLLDHQILAAEVVVVEKIQQRFLLVDRVVPVW